MLDGPCRIVKYESMLGRLTEIMNEHEKRNITPQMTKMSRLLRLKNSFLIKITFLHSCENYVFWAWFWVINGPNAIRIDDTALCIRMRKPQFQFNCRALSSAHQLVLIGSCGRVFHQV